MKKPLSILFLATLLFLFSLSAHAAFRSGGSSSRGPIFFSAGVGASSGTIKGTNAGLASRGMVVYGLNSDLGARFGSLKVGVGVEYDMWKQLKDPSEFSGTNAQGKEFSLAPMLGYDFGAFSLNGRYYLSSKYTLDKADSSGNKMIFSKPKTSFSVDVRIPFGSGLPYIGLEYKSMKYGTVEVGGTSSSLASGSEITASSFGASVGIGF